MLIDSTKLLTPKQAADLIGVSRNLVSCWLQEGGLQRVSICGRRFIDRDDLRMFLEKPTNSKLRDAALAKLTAALETQE